MIREGKLSIRPGGGGGAHPFRRSAPPTRSGLTRRCPAAQATVPSATQRSKISSAAWANSGSLIWQSSSVMRTGGPTDFRTPAKTAA